jgi:succinate-acetate transporter protein
LIDMAATSATTTGPRFTRAAARSEEVGASPYLADPAALGLAAFALSTMVLSIINAGILPAADAPVALSLALAYGGIVQLLAGTWAFVKNDTFAAVALSSYGGFWISFYLLEHVFLKQIPAGDQAGALALYLFAWGAFTLYMWIGSFRVSLAVQAVFLTLWPAYVLLGLGQALGSMTLFHIGGILGIATAACAWYVSAAIVLNKTFGREVLPVGEVRPVQQDAA